MGMDLSAAENENALCPHCHGSGWAPVETDGVAAVQRCDCRKNRRIEELLRRARIPVRYEHCTLEEYLPNPHYESQKKAKMLVQRFIKEYPAVNAGLLLMGPCGVGKTHLAISLLKQVITEKGDAGVFYDFRDLLREIRASWNSVSQSSELDVLRPVIEAKVLVLDELGADKPTEWVKDTIAHIINYRYNEQRITIFTSNYPDKPTRPGEESLSDRIGVRLRSRLYEMCQEINIDGMDNRQEIRKATF